MTIDDRIKNAKLQYDTNENTKEQKYQHYRQINLINIIILQVKKYCHLIKVKY